jgi:chromosome segregation ATPase
MTNGTDPLEMSMASMRKFEAQKQDEVTRLRARVQELEEQLRLANIDVSSTEVEMNAAEAEVSRLREALEELRRSLSHDEAGPILMQYMRDKVAAALKPEGEGTCQRYTMG